MSPPALARGLIGVPFDGRPLPGGPIPPSVTSTESRSAGIAQLLGDFLLALHRPGLPSSLARASAKAGLWLALTQLASHPTVLVSVNIYVKVGFLLALLVIWIGHRRVS